MEILPIFRKFTTAIADIEQFRAAVVSAADREYRHLLEQKASGLEIKSLLSLNFPDADSGHLIHYGFRDISIDDAVKNLLRHVNRQHQWFLVEAYEVFEEFLKYSYAVMGMANPAHWPLRDFGVAQWEELQNKNYGWYLELARQKKDMPLATMRQFSKSLPCLAAVEDSNRFGCSLKVAVMLVAHMRHQIVHARGVVMSKSEFAAAVVKKMGDAGAGMKQHLKFIDGALLIVDGEISLLDVPALDSTPPFRFHCDIFDILVAYLLAYAHQIYLSLGGPHTEDFHGYVEQVG